MTQAKKLKRAIRARVKKTGERYAAARRQVLAARTAVRKKTLRPTATPSRRASARGAGLEARVQANTGRSLDHWFGVLDAFGAVAKGHTAAARHLAMDHRIGGWYAQAITVAYERARGLRAVNQRLSGHYDVSVSKVLDAPLERVADALARPAERAAWLRGSDPALQKSLRDALSGEGARPVKMRAGKDAYVRYPADGRTIEIRVLAKAGGRSTIVATVMKIKTAAAKEEQRAAWKVAFEGLKAHLAG